MYLTRLKNALYIREGIITMNEITKAEMRKRLGNITQLQELLFGEKIEEYNCKLEQYDQKLTQIEANSQKFQLAIEERIANLEKKLIHNINSVTNSLERKIKYLNISAQQEQNKLQQGLDSISQHTYENIDLLQNSISANTNSLKMEINQTKSTLDKDMQLLKQQVFEKLESNLSELSSNKIARGDLAEVLFEICLKLKETDVDLTLSESEENQEIAESNQAHTDLMLPENNHKN